MSRARTIWFVFGVGLVIAGPCLAQETRPSLLAVDSSSSLDRVVDERGNYTSGVLFDVYVSAKIGRGFEVATRPFAQRTVTGEWNRQIWLAAVRYERAGDIGLRVEGGLIPAPVGLANLGLRPHLNPTIAQPSSLFVPLPSPEPMNARLSLLGPIYPYGVNATVSGTHWDVRAAVIDTSPLRARRIFSATNPPRFMNVVLGGGITPFVGLRLGGSVTRGKWRLPSEAPLNTRHRDATVMTLESEFSFRYTKVSGEWVRDVIDIAAGDSVASGWFVQGQQTVTPRWFVASRVERMSATARLLFPPQQQYFTGTEETIGFRLTPEVTLRASHRARRGFGLSGFDHTAAVSIVWWRRWI